ncbi:hypothetical protein [Amycolatopsis sp. YIM 10]|uniref:hypothetical protein n=1 Tax=Amycolatopsis sp. YIM 10 TaxID=2653857 RepID=UPI0012A7A0B1|nr:hypothetical protein [Amycolatopsis sp. YIM 10]QFU88903.1 hypothetical protein YIM_18615 [Amycolatopsis sp. YIM 10]
MSTPDDAFDKPEADALEQSRPAVPDTQDEPAGTEVPLEADPADAADQREPAGLDEEY